LSELLQIIKQAAAEQNQATKPMAVMVGNVVASSPLKIQIEQKLTLSESALILTKAVIDYSVNMTVNHTTQSHTHAHSYIDDSSTRVTETNTHSHAYSGTKAFTIHNKLNVGDNVILLRVQGGQKFVVLDIVGGGTL
jgi:HSP90 family molecular chaperone